jgi:hypothetical protein
MAFINDLPDYLLHSFDPVYINNNIIDCLLYADDVILLSNSQKGFQSKLDSLELFCKEWCMSVNISKTKVVIFNKSGRFTKQNFLLNNKVLDTESKTELYKKAVKALFKLKADVLSLYPMPKTSLHIFDHTLSNLFYYTVQKYGVVIYQNQLTLTLCLTIQDYHLYFPVINYIFIFVNIYWVLIKQAPTLQY